MSAMNNPAGRLLTIINAGKAQPKKKRAADIWGALLEVSPQDKTLLLERVGGVLSLPSKIRTEISQIKDVNEGVYLKWLPTVERSFNSLNFDAPWQQFIDIIDEAAIYGMEVCSELLSRMSPEKIIDMNSMDTLKSQIDELLSSLDDQDIDLGIKKFIYEHLTKIKFAIEEYKINGTVPLEDEFHSVLGCIVTNPGIYSNSKETEAGKGFWGVMGKLAVLVTITVGAIQIGQDTIDLIPYIKELDDTVIIEQETEEETNAEIDEILSKDGSTGET